LATRTRTILFTDLSDYTARVSSMDGEALREMVRVHEGRVHPSVERHGGRVVKNIGDSFLCVFESTTRGLLAAIEILELLGNQSDEMRLSLAVGDVEVIDGDVFGEAVNLAARILAITPAGSIWFGESARFVMRESEIPWSEVGSFSFKGIAGESRVFQAVPKHRVTIPTALRAAVRENRLVQVRPGTLPPRIPPASVVLLEGFRPGSSEVRAVIDALPVLNPGDVWLATYYMTPGDRVAWESAGRSVWVGMPEAQTRALEEARIVTTITPGADTLVFDAGRAVSYELMVGGLALPRVPLSDVVAGYSYDLLTDGRWVHQASDGVLRVSVSSNGVRLRPREKGVQLNGRQLRVDEDVPLEHDAVIRCRAGALHFVELEGAYLGLVLGESPLRLGIREGDRAELGREPEHPGLAFPDRRRQANILWCVGAKARHARSSGFTLDRALAGRRQAAIQIVEGQGVLDPVHTRCATWLHRATTHALSHVREPVSLEAGDHIVAGTTVVSFRAVE